MSTRITIQSTQKSEKGLLFKNCYTYKKKKHLKCVSLRPESDEGLKRREHLVEKAARLKQHPRWVRLDLLKTGDQHELFLCNHIKLFKN